MGARSRVFMGLAGKWIPLTAFAETSGLVDLANAWERCYAALNRAQPQSSPYVPVVFSNRPYSVDSKLRCAPRKKGGIPRDSEYDQLVFLRKLFLPLTPVKHLLPAGSAGDGE
jgi:hypothetical protein